MTSPATAAGMARRSAGTRSAASCCAASWTPPSSTCTCRQTRIGDWRPARRSDGCPVDETIEHLADLKRHFPTPRDAVVHILNTFPGVRREEQAKHGEYRIKRIILEIYDAMQASLTIGGSYQTRLDPAPADTRCCHPPRENT